MTESFSNDQAMRIVALAAEWGLGWILLAAARWFGLLLVLPALSQAGLSIRFRAMLAIVLAGVVLPVISRTAMLPPTDALSLVGFAVGEFLIGAAIGLGIRIMLAAVQLAGELLDHQAGLAISQVFHPALEGNTTISGNLLTWVAISVFLLLPPLGGDLHLVAAMLDLFEQLPIGSAGMLTSPTDLLVVLVQQSLALAIGIAAPVLAVMSLITLAVAWIGRSTPGLPVTPLAGTLRIVTCLIVITLTIPSMMDAMAETFRTLLESGPQLIASMTASLPMKPPM